MTSRQSAYPATPRTVPTRKPQRVTYDREAVHAVRDAAFVCHVGFVVDGAPAVPLSLYVRIGEIVYLHGSTGARALRSAPLPREVRCGPSRTPIPTGRPDDPDDLQRGHWAGVVPLRVVAGDPVPEAGVLRPYPADLRVRV